MSVRRMVFAHPRTCKTWSAPRETVEMIPMIPTNASRSLTISGVVQGEEIALG